MSKPRRPRKPGLWLPTVKVEAEYVRKSHKSVCHVCGRLPEGRRLKVTVGSGRGGSSYVLCADHGETFVRRRIIEAENLVLYLHDLIGADAVRLTPQRGDPSYRPPAFPKDVPEEDQVDVYMAGVEAAKSGVMADVKEAARRWRKWPALDLVFWQGVYAND